MLRIEMFGHFHLIHEGAHLIHLTRPRLRNLLVYLLLNRRRVLPRQRLAFCFWPDTPESQAHSNVRNLLTKLRQAVPELTPFLQIDEQVVGWRVDSAFSLDVADFESALQEAERANQRHDGAALLAALEKAVDLYSGELLPDLYDDWVLAARQRLQDDFFYALEWLIQLCKQRQEYGRALRYAQIYVEREPLSEVAYRYLIELHALNGDRASAARAYQLCCAVLWRELAVEPSPTTQAFYGRLVAPPNPPATVGNADRGLHHLLRGWAELTARGSQSFPGVLHFLTNVITVLIKQGCLLEAQRLIDQGFAYLTTPGEAPWEAELHRLRGGLLLQQGVPATTARIHYQRALEVAQRHQAHFLALRAATDLCRLEADHSPEFPRTVWNVYRRFVSDLSPTEAADLWAALAEFP